MYTMKQLKSTLAILRDVQGNIRKCGPGRKICELREWFHTIGRNEKYD